MTVKEFRNILSVDAQISKEQMGALEEMVANYPWFACGQQVLLKAVKHYEPASFDERLAFVSLCATSREQLQKYLQDENANQVNQSDLQVIDGFEWMPEN